MVVSSTRSVEDADLSRWEISSRSVRSLDRFTQCIKSFLSAEQAPVDDSTDLLRAADELRHEGLLCRAVAGVSFRDSCTFPSWDWQLSWISPYVVRRVHQINAAQIGRVQWQNCGRCSDFTLCPGVMSSRDGGSLVFWCLSSAIHPQRDSLLMKRAFL